MADAARGDVPHQLGVAARLARAARVDEVRREADRVDKVFPRFEVTVTDRGPALYLHRDIDLSVSAFRHLADLGHLAVGNRDIGLVSSSAGAVDHDAVLDDEIVAHGVLR